MPRREALIALPAAAILIGAVYLWVEPYRYELNGAVRIHRVSGEVQRFEGGQYRGSRIQKTADPAEKRRPLGLIFWGARPELPPLSAFRGPLSLQELQDDEEQCWRRLQREDDPFVRPALQLNLGSIREAMNRTRRGARIFKAEVESSQWYGEEVSEARATRQERSRRSGDLLWHIPEPRR